MNGIRFRNRCNIEGFSFIKNDFIDTKGSEDTWKSYLQSMIGDIFKVKYQNPIKAKNQG